MQLYSNVETVLKAISEKHIYQIILSASAKENLFQQIGLFNIEKYFSEILGISDIYAKSKVEIGIESMSRNSVQNALLIGDTTHDFEVSQALGVDCVLISQGHQSKEKLLLCGVPVLDDIQDVLQYII